MTAGSRLLADRFCSVFRILVRKYTHTRTRTHKKKQMNYKNVHLSWWLQKQPPAVRVKHGSVHFRQPTDKSSFPPSLPSSTAFQLVVSSTTTNALSLKKKTIARWGKGHSTRLGSVDIKVLRKPVNPFGVNMANHSSKRLLLCFWLQLNPSLLGIRGGEDGAGFECIWAS